MTFPERLTELIDKEFPVFASAEFLKDHAEAIRDLVVAAEEVVEWSTVSNNEDDFIVRLGKALAKLEEA